MTQNKTEIRKMRILDLMEEPSYVPMREKELACIMQVDPEDRPELKRILQELLTEGKIQINKRGRYSKPEQQLLTGIFTSHQKGFGFVQIEGREEDLYIPEDQVNGAYHLDTVEVRILPERHGQRQEAQIARILARGTTHVVGTYQKSRNFGFVIPDNTKLPSDIFVSQERSKGAVSGSKVVVEITDYGGAKRRSPEGKVVEILGHINDPGVDIMSIVRNFDLPEVFPEKVMNQAERYAPEVTEADREGRLDLRDLTMVTIDGEDAKDLDDAISVEKLENNKGYRLYVHIADVSHYVRAGSAIDQEAYARGTSVYVVDRVVPMLPHALCNGICSLNPRVDRLTLTCCMDIDKKGEIDNYKIYPSIICSDERMTYKKVNAILAGDAQSQKEYPHLLNLCLNMKVLSGIIRRRESVWER